jgi:hypothetical protein
MSRTTPRPALYRGRALRAAVWALTGVAGFAVYLRLAQTRAVNSDGAVNALQAWDMLHGNPLLRGWRVSDVSFYTTELPQYALIELVRGLNAGVVQIAAAMTYTLAVLTAALLAKGTATGREGVLRACVAAGIMLAPQLGDGTNVLLSSPDHIGTSVPILLAWIILDRCGRRWYVPPAVSLLLGLATIGDTLTLYVAVIPVALVCLYRICHARRLLGFEIALGLGAPAAGAAALGVLKLIHAAGGFYTSSPHAVIAPLSQILPHNLTVVGEDLLLLGGASFLHLRTSTDYVFAALHLVGVALAAWAVAATLWRWTRVDLVDQVVVVGIATNLAGYMLTTLAIDLPTSREINPVLPLAAVLVGRRVGPVLTHSAQRVFYIPALAAIAAGYLAGLVHEAAQPAVRPQNAALSAWLQEHHLASGLSGYWESMVVTLTTGGQVRVSLVSDAGGRFSASRRETKVTWYDPSQSAANFVVLSPGIEGYPGFTDERAALATFGKPAHVYHYERYTILVWNKNILRDLRHP